AGVEGGQSPVSGVLLAILLGILARNLFKLPQSLDAGLKLGTTTVLRLGIVLVGIKLSLLDLLRLGAVGVPVVVVCILTALVAVRWLSVRMGLPERLGTLIAAGTSICGITAIVSTAPAIKADQREVAYAVANVALFGLLGMLTYPYLAHALFPTPEQVGLFLGTAIHDTSQVLGGALTYREVYDSEAALKVATVTKLTRNLFLAAVVPYLAWTYARREHRPGERIDYKKLFPAFVLGFVAMALVRTVGDATQGFGLLGPDGWKAVTHHIGDVVASRWLLGIALASVGLQTSFGVFRGVGLKPFAVGLAAAALVGATSMGLTLALGRFL
ncbi:MAG: putative sulfate exporter family transporter, partial [Candidatus Eremiobacterota bacterium]